MGLNIVSGGDYGNFVKYNAKADKWFVREEGTDTEIQRPTFIADFANIKTGWYYFAEGQAPQVTLDPTLADKAPKPSDKHKRGFEMMLFSQASFGGVAKFSSASMHVCSAIAELYTSYEAEAPANAGKVPVVECTGSTAQKDKFGTNYKPSFKIVKWVDRPAELDGNSTGNTQADAPTAPPAKKVVNEF